MAAEDHLRLADQQVGDAEGLLVLLWAREVLVVQFLQAHHKMTEASQEELAAVHPVGVTLVLPFDRTTHRPGANTQTLLKPHIVGSLALIGQT